jgi:hypothetical protein
MAARGISRAANGEPDLRVKYHAAIQSRLEVSTIHESYGYPYYRGYPGAFAWGGYTTHAVEYDEGTLMLDFFDAKSRQLVWRGVAQAEVHLDASPERKEKRIQEAVDKMLALFPPAAEAR